MSVIKVLFMTIMIGSSPEGATSQSPSVAKETTELSGSSAMQVCRRLENVFHVGSVATQGEIKVSTQKFNTGVVRRESSCIQYMD